MKDTQIQRVYRFLKLSWLSRTEILKSLNLLDKEDEGIEHIEMIDTILFKANATGVLDKLWEKVDMKTKHIKVY